jgi:hypothetical protein
MLTPKVFDVTVVAIQRRLAIGTTVYLQSAKGAANLGLARNKILAVPAVLLWVEQLKACWRRKLRSVEKVHL